MKVINKSQRGSSSLQRLFLEVQSMKALNHNPRVVKLLEVAGTMEAGDPVTESTSEGQVFELRHACMRKGEPRGRFCQIAPTVWYYHQEGVIHRDLKPESLLLESDPNIKVAYSGFSNEFTTAHKLTPCCGSPPWVEPGAILYTMTVQ